MNALEEFNAQVEEAVRNRDGLTLRTLLRESTDLTLRATKYFYEHQSPLPHPMEEHELKCLPKLVEGCFASAGAIRLDHWVDAYEHLARALSIFLEDLESHSDWSLPLFHQLCEDVRVVAQIADDVLRDNNRRPCKLEAAERILKRGFTAINKDRSETVEGSRRVGVLGIINQLLKVYFKLNNLALCVNLTRTVNASNFPPMYHFPLEHRVIYKYYAGRLALYDDKYEEAVRDLTYAMQHVPSSLQLHRRRIMLYLIPAKILTGSLPTDATVRHFGMKWYADIVTAVRTGNVESFNMGVEAHEDFFIRTALYLTIEKMRALVHRQLVRQASALLDSNKVALTDIQVCLSVCKTEMDRNEIECILTNLIYNNFIKGYVSHKVGYLVLSKKNPFPKLNAVNAGTA